MSSKPQKLFSSPANIALYDAHIYLVGALVEPDQYLEEFQILREAKEDEIITIHINCSGGYIHTAVQFMNCIKECRGTVVTQIEGYCHSAATLIFLSGDELKVHDHCLMLVHNYSGGSAGKGSDIVLSAAAQHNWITNLMKESYLGFLYPEEIEQVSLNQDIWLASHDIIPRLTNLVEYRQTVVDKLEEEERQKLKEQVRTMYANLNPNSEGVSEEPTEH